MSRSVVVLLALFALLASSCTAQEPGLYRVTLVTEGEHVFRPTETVPGDLVILGGQISLQEGSRVAGSVTMLSGNVVLDGRVDGDVSLLNGTLTLGPRARMQGDLTVGGGVLERSPEARIAGRVNTGSGGQILNVGGLSRPSPGEQLTRALVGVIFLAPFAVVLVALLPRRVQRVAKAAAEQPLVAGALGILVAVVAPSLLVLLAFTIVLIPVAMLGALFLALAAVYGWVALGLALGRRIASLLDREVGEPVAALLGVLSLTLWVGLLGLLPAVGMVVALAVVALGLGAVFLTGFGARVFVPASEDR